jgi:hypothetical protein
MFSSRKGAKETQSARRTTRILALLANNLAALAVYSMQGITSLTIFCNAKTRGY